MWITGWTSEFRYYKALSTKWKVISKVFPSAQWRRCACTIPILCASGVMQLLKITYGFLIKRRSNSPRRVCQSAIFVDRYTQGIWDLSKVYLPELLERVSAGKLEPAGILSIFVNFKVFSFVKAHNNKTLVPYLDVILIFVFKTSTFNSSNSQYLEIFVFIRINFKYFRDNGIPRNLFRSPQKMVVFLYVNN